MKKIVHKSAIPLYVAAVTWLLYALLFPLYRLPHFLLAAAAAAGVDVISVDTLTHSVKALDISMDIGRIK